jgi:hypothetical protein
MWHRSLPNFPPKMYIVGLPVSRLPHDTTELLQSTIGHLPGLSVDSRPAVARRYFNCVEEHCPWLRHGQCSSTQEERWGCAPKFCEGAEGEKGVAIVGTLVLVLG